MNAKTYDANGNVTGITETYSSGISNRVLSMTYDDVNRLKVENSTVGGGLTATQYDYDSADNCIERKVTVGSAPHRHHYLYLQWLELADRSAAGRGN